MLSFFQRDVLDQILNLIESVSEVFLPTLPYHSKTIIVRYKKLVITYVFCGRRHAWLLIQSRLTALLTSLIARR